MSVLRQQFEHDKRYCCVDGGKCPKKRTRKPVYTFHWYDRPSERYKISDYRAVRFAEISPYNQNQSEYWTEYLLYNTQQGFVWLIESGKRWRLSETLHTWPDFDSSGNPAGEMLIDHYRGQVEAAAGAFYWKVKQGDLLHYKEYSGKKSYGRNVILCSEQSRMK